MQVKNEITIKGTRVFEDNWKALQSSNRFIVNEGGSRSSKTWSLCQCLILYCLQNPNKMISIVRKTGPALRATVYRDFFDVLKSLDLYDESNHRKMEGLYQFPNGSTVEFFSVDQEQKVRGRKRDICWANEANELNYEDFQQLALRTSEKMIVDYNPSAPESYLYYLPEDKTVLIHSTYRDNPFLSKEIVEQIESYKFSDPDYYSIFTLGKRCFSRENVYPEWPTSPTKPDHLHDFIYAIDYGFTHPTALLKIWYTPESREIYVEELIYESYLTPTDIVERFDSLNIAKHAQIIAETARPEINNDLKRKGYKITNANKNVSEGILNVKTFNITISSLAENTIKENFNYRYKKHNGKISEEPVKLYDDSMDALRYGLMYIKRYCLKENNRPSQVYSFDF